ncbi:MULTISPECIES: response regulator transcription factor [Streptomyces]|nr:MULTISPECIES: response regulator transcription factor [Streptomyces]MDW8478237.1 response regulator transcription factor [Streptomyces scabiei]MDX2538526.1 response regulator transcription factor [Streptomyces scabiei]MDX2565799.1 response regulator transcription factor [Streptomyces scabiei]MDX2576963.1 response regulator transcription factor [Streptomyces scabiei]MDX2625086.1 response regulator transcription factor [Streptomyces scabiei]
MGIDVMVFDDLHLSRSALTALLEQRAEIKVVGSVDSKLAALEFAELHRPDVVVISFDGRDAETIDLAEKIAVLPECRTLLVATVCIRSVVRRAFTGEIDGMVRRSAPPRRFFEAVHLVHQGERAFDAELTVAAVAGGDCPLTLRQLSVLEHLDRGDTMEEIADRLCLSEGTVRNYISSVVAKMGARNRIDALRIARDLQWI